MSNTPILMTEDYWANSPFSIARYYGTIRMRGVLYIIVNKEGKDVFQLSIEAEKAGREKTIEPGEPCGPNRCPIPVYLQKDWARKIH